MNWHLHVTVQPHWSWTLSDVASALSRDVERHGVKPVVITNHFRDPLRQPYKELIPTQHFEGDEATATRKIFNLGVLLNNAGWRVRRLKIEGDPREGSVHQRAIYFETHLKTLQPDTIERLRLPLSTNAKGENIYTMRRYQLCQIQIALCGLVEDYHVEAAVLDTNPALDNDWINE